MSDDRRYDCRGRPPVDPRYSYDLDAAQHLLADHAEKLIVAFDHHGRDPEVFIYAEAPDGTLSAGDYYLWPFLHETATRIKAELSEGRRNSKDPWRWNYYRGRLRKWVNRLPQLHNLIRIRKSTIHALCAWDLQGRRPKELVVLDTDRNLTGWRWQEALEVADSNREDAAESRPLSS